jgi:hypothetical protein
LFNLGEGGTKMKKNIKILLLIFCGFFVFIFGGCSNSDEIISVTVKNNSSDNPFEIYIGEVDYSQYYLIVEYESGEVIEVNINKDMINPVDEVKLYRIGIQEIKVDYNKKSTIMYFNISKRELTDLYLEDMNVTYTGEYYEVKVSGNVPKDAVITYPNGNKFKDVGKYEVEALIYEEGFNVKKLTSTIIINKATYDLGSINFSDATFVYDGNPKSIMVEGELPKGVSVSYVYSDFAKSVGVYEVTAKFHGDYDNYEIIPDMKATITITKAKYNIEEIEFEETVFTYDGNPHTLKLKNEHLLPEGIEVSYENNVQTDAGVYDVTISFIGDNVNYEAIEDLTTQFTINKAEYDLSKIYFESCIFKYDGNSKVIAINGDLPEGVSVEYYIYSSNLDISYEEFPIQVGTYVVVAKFSHNNNNYLDIKDMHAIIVIES